ncbi:hypothetical protein [Kribbella solani]|uniref:Secreted protein n=1 Tax=Kribbella solani TaxID=236067 RepID=A0A841DZR1_9ACTN|nr:hypothetical protein [Kribbella solani]MBB5982276.1 hypothetical protein [Kribbella solani]
MFQKITLAALACVSIATLAVAPASAESGATRREFEIKDPLRGGNNFRGSLITSNTEATFDGYADAYIVKLTGLACISASISGCNLVGNQKKVVEMDSRPHSDFLHYRVNKTYTKTSGQSVWVRACFVHADGTGTCSGWK